MDYFWITSFVGLEDCNPFLDYPGVNVYCVGVEERKEEMWLEDNTDANRKLSYVLCYLNRFYDKVFWKVEKCSFALLRPQNPNMCDGNKILSCVLGFPFTWS